VLSNAKLFKQGSDLLSDPSFYRSVVGTLQYVTIRHPELSYFVRQSMPIYGQGVGISLDCSEKNT